MHVLSVSLLPKNYSQNRQEVACFDAQPVPLLVTNVLAKPPLILIGMHAAALIRVDCAVQAVCSGRVEFRR